MNSSDPSPLSLAEQEQSVLQQARLCLRIVCAELPHLSGLAAIVRLHCDRNISVAAVNPAGDIFINPTVFSTLSKLDAAYILAHEIMHIALDTFSRRVAWIDSRLINIAHDYVINDLLTEELVRMPPLGGLYRPGAGSKSLEQIVIELRRDYGDRACDLTGWDPDGAGGRNWTPRTTLGQALDAAGIKVPSERELSIAEGSQSGSHGHGDVIWGDSKPLAGSPDALRQTEVRAAIEQALSIKSISGLDSLRSDSGGGEGRYRWTEEALKSHFTPPWEAALQKWFEGQVPGDRTYSRPSRRGADRTDVVLPGRLRIGWTLHVILDTSGSMLDDLPRILGTIGNFCENCGVQEVHVVQCGDMLTADDWIKAEEIGQMELIGGGGGGLTPGFQRLAEDPDVQAAIVITDTYEDYPLESPPFEVLWAVIDNRLFVPPYGTQVFLERS